RGRRVPDQHTRRLCGRQCAVPDVARSGRARRVVLRATRLRGDARAMSTLALPRAWPAFGRAVLLALMAFAIFGPLLNLFLWAFAEKWYFPYKLPQEFGLTYWARVFQPRGNALASLGTSVWIALLTVVVSLVVAIPAGYALARVRMRWRGLI